MEQTTLVVNAIIREGHARIWGTVPACCQEQGVEGARGSEETLSVRGAETEGR
jgi:hypothetical protein